MKEKKVYRSLLIVQRRQRSEQLGGTDLYRSAASFEHQQTTANQCNAQKCNSTIGAIRDMLDGKVLFLIIFHFCFKLSYFKTTEIFKAKLWYLF